jgi:hypothetical protein
MSMQSPEEPRSSALAEVLPGLEAALVGSAIPSAVFLGSAGESFQDEAEILPYDSSNIPDSSRLRRAKRVIQNLGHAAWIDVKGNDHKVRALSNGIAVSSVQAIGFAKLPSVLIPQAAISVLHSTGSPVEAGATAALLFGTWCLTVGETINSSMGHYPATLRAIGDSWPNVVRHCSDALPGLETSNESAQETRRLSARVSAVLP